MNISKVKLKGDQVEVTFTTQDQNKKDVQSTQTHNSKPHPDLVQALQNLGIHAALITGFVSMKQVKKIETPGEELVQDFKISGISVKTGDDSGVVITGTKTTPFKKAFNFNTPFTRFNEAEENENSYKYIDDLESRVNRVLDEVDEYLNNGKFAEDPQQSLDFGSGTATTEMQDIDFEDSPNKGDNELWEGGERPKTGLTAVN
ncbi:MAG TPA: hypothetical protein VD794_00570 [Flavisolibacter sp.]|nr:hypothetical protein [Flavisolibacter sp.]